MKNRMETLIGILITAVLLILIVQPSAAVNVGFSLDTENANNLLIENGRIYIIRGCDVEIPINITVQGGTLCGYAVNARLSEWDLGISLKDCSGWTSVVNGNKLASVISSGSQTITNTTVRLFAVRINNTESLRSGAEYKLTIGVLSAVSQNSDSPKVIENTVSINFRTDEDEISDDADSYAENNGPLGSVKNTDEVPEKIFEIQPELPDSSVPLIVKDDKTAIPEPTQSPISLIGLTAGAVAAAVIVRHFLQHKYIFQ
ncbi:MAG: hypothetical protein Q4Q53_00010 [Methanocorpusculum sp.]|nr:hypothetical protein [Methanocorpusculum sp.]